MKIEKYREEIHQKYLPKVQYIVNVMNSCETTDQGNVCLDWGKRLITSWVAYENMLIDKKHGGWEACKLSSCLTKEFSFFVDILAVVRDRKAEELSETEEI